MRTLRFIVHGQQLKPAPGCDFTGLVPGTVGYLEAQFEFDSEWNGCAKAASFFRFGGKEFAAPIVNGRCEIPAEALEKEVFKVSVTGARKGFRITTNRIDVYQKG